LVEKYRPSITRTTKNVADFLADRPLAAGWGRTVGKETEGTGVQALLDKVNDLVHEGNVRRVVVTDRAGRKILDLPVNAGLIAAVLAPMLTGAGAALALAGGWHINVERADPDVVDGEAGQSEPTEPTATEKPEEAGS
jgi:hypothetical protein